MKTFIHPLLVCAATLVTLFSMTGCETANSPGIIGNDTHYPPSRTFSSEGGAWNGPRSTEDAVRYGGLPQARESAPAPALSRPGLATTAGYETSSRVLSGWFYRKPGGGPDATDSFHYNDETGAKAMTDVLGGASRRNGLFPAAGNRIRVGLRSNGDDLPRLESGGQRVVIGQPGTEFYIPVKNTTKHRLEVVVSVDGIDVLDGKPASMKKNGYVLEPGQEYTIMGFRKNLNQVKQFMFGSVSQSEAAKKGMARNVGVVGLAVYEEDEAAARAAQLAEASKRSGASAFPRN